MHHSFVHCKFCRRDHQAIWGEGVKPQVRLWTCDDGGRGGRVWDILTQGWVGIHSISEATLATLTEIERVAIRAHLDAHVVR